MGREPQPWQAMWDWGKVGRCLGGVTVVVVPGASWVAGWCHAGEAAGGCPLALPDLQQDGDILWEGKSGPGGTVQGRDCPQERSVGRGLEGFAHPLHALPCGGALLPQSPPSVPVLAPCWSAPSGRQGCEATSAAGWQGSPDSVCLRQGKQRGWTKGLGAATVLVPGPQSRSMRMGLQGVGNPS